MLNDLHDDESDLSDPDVLAVHEFDVRGAVFIIPTDAPVPSELNDAPISKGSLYQRLEPITHDPESEFVLVPLSGAEMLALDRAWRVLQDARKVYALFDLPGAKYDVTFTQAVRQIGLHKVEWAMVATAMANRVRIVQRTKDTQPWVLADKKAHETATDVYPEDDIKGVPLLRPIPSERDDADT